MKSFTVTVEQQPGLTLITVAGELNLQTLPAVEDATVVVPLGGKVLHVELSGVPFMDSSGLNLLLRLRRRMRQEAGHLVVSGLQEQPAGLLRLTGTYELLTAADSVGVTSPVGRRSPSRV
ncbi:STAS domain-containing protein [Streptomyces agglomeratus]|uniref:STAS domain-containing protein n=1 Tax=Streptomyces agglomeratus TaxID=285458 RepID=UPI0009A04F00|nr:STAS domain-containing protein [Streptomyces agglomeratus]